MKVIIGGIPGVGKTTVLDELVKEGFRVENYGDAMLKEAISRDYAKNRDELRKLPVEKQKEIQKVAADKLAQISDVIIDTHFSINTKGGYLPGLPVKVLEAINPDLFVSIEADPLEIFERRKNDPRRNRDKDSLERIRAHLDANRSYGITYSAMTGSPFLVVMNENGKVKEASAKIISVIRPNDGGEQ
ncbi:MAG: adenylate kinase [Candidatus Thermoplasmatota archaeon]|jgi:adenylate kinase|nr:adenylate kinase [Candidatus Thermoplasmatota archaeon]MCL5930110.1 adenylate kinase [Candidatus Thermoplasmatota archaeon]